jgi:hypothetical protein
MSDTAIKIELYVIIPDHVEPEEVGRVLREDLREDGLEPVYVTTEEIPMQDAITMALA